MRDRGDPLNLIRVMPAKGQGCTDTRSFSRRESPVSIIGAGIAGAWQALLFAQAGHAVTLHERSDEAMMLSTSHWAGGMLAPYCESEVSEPIISRLGLRALDLWRRELPDTPFNGSLVVAHARDRNDFERFARLHVRPPAARRAGLAELEPSLEGRFREAPVLRRRGPCRAAPRAAETARAHHRRRRHHQVQQRRERRGSRRHRDRLPRACRARRRSPNCAASRAR